MMSFNLTILAPDRTFLQQSVTEVILPTSTGSMGVLANHITLLTALDTGILRIKSQSEPWMNVVVLGGFALIKNNTVFILVNDAEFASDLNLKNTEEMFQKAQQEFDGAQTAKDKILTKMRLERAKIRLLAATAELS